MKSPFTFSNKTNNKVYKIPNVIGSPGKGTELAGRLNKLINDVLINA